MQHLVNLLRGLPRGFANPGLKSMAKEGAPVVSTAFFAPKKNRPLATSTTDAIARNHLSHKVLNLPWWKCLTCHLQKLQGLTLSRHSTNCAEKSCTGAYQSPAQKHKIVQPFVAKKIKNMWKSTQVPCYIKGVWNKESLSSPLVERTWSCITSLTRRARQYVPPARTAGHVEVFLFPYFLGTKYLDIWT